MKSLLRAIYVFLSGPLYRRLSHEMAIKLQAQIDAQVQFEEKFIQRVLDDLVVLSIRVEDQNRLLQSVFPNSDLSQMPTDNISDSGLTDAQIIELVHEARSGRELCELAAKWNISPLLAAKLKARLYGIGDHSLGLVRSMERENARLTRALSTSNETFNAGVQTSQFSAEAR